MKKVVMGSNSTFGKDSKGNIVRFDNVTIVMTSNIGFNNVPMREELSKYAPKIISTTIDFLK